MRHVPVHRRFVRSMRRKYNCIHRFYGWIERFLGPTLDIIIRQKIAPIPNLSSCTALEYACGSGLLTLKLAPLFKSITGRDISSGMLARARARAGKGYHRVTFEEGDLLAIDEPENSYDYVFVCFGLHLFSPEVVVEILATLCKVARKSLVIIDHGKKWHAGMALIEWLEGSHYAQFLDIDFERVARQIGCRDLEQDQIRDCTVLIFRCNDTPSGAAQEPSR